MAFDPPSAAAITQTAERAARAEMEHMVAMFQTRRRGVCVDAIKAHVLQDGGVHANLMRQRLNDPETPRENPSREKKEQKKHM